MARAFGIISPHLDDASLSCSQFIAAYPGSQITTVFAGGPRYVSPLTEWDRASKCFRDGDDVIGIRRKEDARSAVLLGATTHHLEFWDRQYRSPQYRYRGVGEEELAGSIAEELERHARTLAVDAWVVPLGLGHIDHRLTAEACLAFAGARDGEFFVYEELPYRQESADDVARARLKLEERGFRLTKDESLQFVGGSTMKKAAIRCHVSQRRALRGRVRTAVRGPEHIWRLERR
ncbi:MAG: hypothetical protein JWO62_3119 [Acidimicrobiaceae bacterium]|nr:hypothetical protein [Acidimicrobiaceae bacterium]